MSARRLLGLLTTLALVLPARVHAQGGFLWQGVASVEGWKTDSASLLLARGGGHPSLLGRVDSWAAAEPITNIIAFAEVLGERGSALDETGNDVYLKQYGLRYSPADAFTIEAGRITQVVGTFSARQLATRNPLIGVPDGYGATYPKGARIDGSLGMVDYRAGVLSLPVWRSGYTPEPSTAWRPAYGVGVTPIIGLRVGMSGTYGSYLNDSYTASQLNGNVWSSFKENIVAADAEFSRGYFEAHFEGAHSTYDIPGRPDTQNGLEYYLESKYTFTPRFYVAARFEQNDYPFIAAFGPVWVAANSKVSDGEVGGGFRILSGTLLKLAFRKDRWSPNPNPGAPHDDGYALNLQLSQGFDVMDLITRKQ